MVSLYPHQQDAVEALNDGNVLWGGVGSGKTRTSLAYYMKNHSDKDLLVITTAKKRDSLDWESEAHLFGIGRTRDATIAGVMTVDSWNNIKKYEDIRGYFVILDEQRLVGNGAWVKSFLKIAKQNSWILLSATPGDTWMDYVPVFLANGFYENRTQFKRMHAVYAAWSKYPRVERYIATGRLNKYRNQILVHMPYKSRASSTTERIPVQYDKTRYDLVMKKRWNPWKEKPITNTSELFYCMRKVVNEDQSRFLALRALLKKHPKMIVFYNFDYELDILRELSEDTVVGEWNGHRHDPIPLAESWVYLVQYSAGSESWNCVETNTIVFYSLTYSYKMFHQAKGRVDRLDTEWEELCYYILLSKAPIDKAVMGALTRKKTFNEATMKSKFM